MGFIDKLNDQLRGRDSLFDENEGKFDDRTEIYANGNKLFLEFYHLPSDKSVAFKGYITSWSDKFESRYNAETVYGRNDDIHTFEGTTRSISLSWDVVAGSYEEARNNLARVSMLAQFLYPAYKMKTFNFSNSTGAPQDLKVGTMTKAPLIKVRFANLVMDARGSVNSVDAKDTGLLAALDGLTVEADLEAGVFDSAGLATPKVFKLSANLSVLHEHTLGWDNDSKVWLGTSENAGAYPYNAFGPQSYEGGSSTAAPTAGGSSTPAPTPSGATPPTSSTP
tara:strand:+ start:11423 stop:12262 length:840 start_codon:yes stop_codon:yes gene_type:complete